VDLDRFGEPMQISPFEVKDALIELAASHNDRMMLNAGRGNPNWVSTEPRHGFWQLGRFATIEAERFQGYMREGGGGLPEHAGIVARFDTFVQLNHDEPGVSFLKACVAYVRDRLGYPADAYKAEMKRLVRNRLDTLYRSIGVVHEPDIDSAGYYAELTLDGVARQLYSKEFEDWLLANIKTGEFISDSG
jgi:hypothetical protein